MIDVEVIQNAEELESTQWDAIVPPDWIFHKVDFLKAIQSSRTENALFYFLLFKENGCLVANAVVSVFDIHLDLFIGQHSLIYFIKKIKSNFFDKKVVFCGTPLSQGQSNLYISPNTDAKNVLLLLNNFMESVAKINNTSILIYKEFSKKYVHLYQSFFKNKNYLLAHSLPNTLLDLPFKNFEEYLSALRSTYRRQISHTLLEARPIIYAEPVKKQIFIQEINSKDVNIDDFYEGYLSVMQRSKVKLEVLSKDFFVLFFEKNERIKILQFFKNNKVIAMDAITVVDGKLFFIWTSRFASIDNNDYLNLLYAIIQKAILEKCTQVSLGQTSYYPKMRLGAKPEELFIFIKSKNILFHFILKILNSVLFPKEKLPKLNVFKKI